MARLSERTLADFLGGLVPASEFGIDLDEIRYELGLVSPHDRGRALRAVAACRGGIPPETVSRLLDWKEFEAFCADLLRAYGCLVTENIQLKRPRVQIDIFARSSPIALVVDCKHIRRPAGPSAVSAWVVAQIRRARLLRMHVEEPSPFASAILVLNDGQVRFASGGAVVPVFALRSFVDHLPDYSEFLQLV